MQMCKQQGFATSLIIYGLLAAGIITFVTIAVVKYNSAIEAAVTLRADNANLRQAHGEQLTENYNLQQANVRLNTLLAQRETKRQVTAEFERKLNETLTGLLTNPEIKEWAAVSIPKPIVDSLRNTGTKPDSTPDNKTVPARKPIGPTTSARVE